MRGLTRFSMGDWTALGGLACVGVLLLRGALALAGGVSGAWPEQSFSAHSALLPRVGEVRGDTLPNVLLKAGDQELRLGEAKTLRLTVPAGSGEARAPLAALSTGTAPEWVKSRPKARFEIATDAPRGQYRFDGKDLVFTGLRPGVYEARVGFWLRQGERRFTEPEAFKRGSGNCEAYAKSVCVAAVSTPQPVASGWGETGGLSRWALRALEWIAGISALKVMAATALIVSWHAFGRAWARRALSVFGPSGTRWLGAVPAARSPSYPRVR